MVLEVQCHVIRSMSVSFTEVKQLLTVTGDQILHCIHCSAVPHCVTQFLRSASVNHELLLSVTIHRNAASNTVSIDTENFYSVHDANNF